ncbi:MAG: hypothetical protein ACK5NN_01490 [Sphingomonadaceae bacterium]
MLRACTWEEDAMLLDVFVIRQPSTDQKHVNRTQRIARIDESEARKIAAEAASYAEFDAENSHIEEELKREIDAARMHQQIAKRRVSEPDEAYDQHRIIRTVVSADQHVKRTARARRHGLLTGAANAALFVAEGVMVSEVVIASGMFSFLNTIWGHLAAAATFRLARWAGFTKIGAMRLKRNHTSQDTYLSKMWAAQKAAFILWVACMALLFAPSIASGTLIDSDPFAQVPQWATFAQEHAKALTATLGAFYGPLLILLVLIQLYLGGSYLSFIALTEADAYNDAKKIVSRLPEEKSFLKDATDTLLAEMRDVERDLGRCEGQLKLLQSARAAHAECFIGEVEALRHRGLVAFHQAIDASVANVVQPANVETPDAENAQAARLN